MVEAGGIGIFSGIETHMSGNPGHLSRSCVLQNRNAVFQDGRSLNQVNFAMTATANLPIHYRRFPLALLGFF